jgi:hypothetical protein
MVTSRGGAPEHHVPALQPLLIAFDRERTQEADQRCLMGEDAYDATAAVDFSVMLHAVRSLQQSPVLGGATLARLAGHGPTERVSSTMATPQLRRPSLRHSFNHEVADGKAAANRRDRSANPRRRRSGWSRSTMCGDRVSSGGSHNRRVCGGSRHDYLSASRGDRWLIGRRVAAPHWPATRGMTRCRPSRARICSRGWLRGG